MKEGQNIYAFMEQCVNNPNIEKVLIICDKKYAEKANSRVGGVGNETNIISPEVYNNAAQEKFIPVIMEKDETGAPYLPVYLKSCLYFDFTGDDIENVYQALVRNIYEKPISRRPQLGRRPVWLDEEPSKVNNLKILSRDLFRVQNKGNTNLELFIDEYIIGVKSLYRKEYESNEQYLNDFSAFLEYRNTYLDFIKIIYSKNELSAQFLTGFFERLYNETCNLRAYTIKVNGYFDTDLELFRIHVWELFVCTITFLLNKVDFNIIKGVLVHTYFIYNDIGGYNKEACAFLKFRVWPRKMEGEVKESIKELSNRFTLLGHYLCNERIYEPIYIGNNIADADLFLYQIYKGLNLEGLVSPYDYWFPNTYVYARESDSIWKRLVSKQFCCSVMNIFDVQTLEQLKDIVQKCQHDKPMKYSYSFNEAPDILAFVKLEDIGKMP